MSDLSRDIVACRFREMGGIPPITEIVWNWPYLNDDFLDRQVECTSCHQQFTICMETYHTGVGSWQPSK
jgi:hypothetical protein